MLPEANVESWGISAGFGFAQAALRLLSIIQRKGWRRPHNAAYSFWCSGFSLSFNSFSTASRIKSASRRLPTSASIRRIVSVESLIVVGFIPSGGRPMELSLSATNRISKPNPLTTPFILIYDVVY